MSPENSKYWNLIIRHLADTLSADEEQKLFRWIEQHPDNKELFNQAETLWKLSKAGLKEFDPDTEAEWEKLKQKLQSSSFEIPAASTKRTTKRLWLKIAAAFIVLVGIGFLLKIVFDKNDNQAVMVEVITPADSTVSFYLPDSTHIVLNENSIFTYPETFAENQRKVTLRGEAYFEVEPNPTKPFTAYAGSTQTTVLGTSFNIKAREDDDEVEVDVFEGEVEFSGTENPQETKLHINAQEKATYNKSERSVSKSKSSGKQPKWLKEIEKGLKKFFKNVKKELKKL